MGVYDARKTEQNASDEREVDFTFWNLQNEAELSETEDFIEYLQQKHPAIRSEDLCFEPEGGYARSIVLYMLQEDFERPTSSAPKKKAVDLHAKSVNVSEMSRNHFNWKDTFAGGRELGVAQEVGVSKIPSFRERKNYHEVANILIIYYTIHILNNSLLQKARPSQKTEFTCFEASNAGRYWLASLDAILAFPPGKQYATFLIFSISLVASTMDMCGRGQHKSGLNLSELVEAWDSSGTTAGAASAKGTYISPNSVSVMTEDRKMKIPDGWLDIFHKIYHASFKSWTPPGMRRATQGSLWVERGSMLGDVPAQGL